jgi:hypothetical protein
MFGAQIAEFLNEYKSQINPTGPIRIVYLGEQGEPTAVDEFNGLNQSIYAMGLQNEEEIVGVEWIPVTTTSFESMLSGVASMNPNVLVIAVPPPQVVGILQQGVSFPQLQNTVAIAWTPADDPSVYQLIGKATSYYYYFVITNLPAMANTSDVALNQRWQGSGTSTSRSPASRSARWAPSDSIRCTFRSPRSRRPAPPIRAR